MGSIDDFCHRLATGLAGYLLATLSLGACEVNAPNGAFYCDAKSTCPTDLVCNLELHRCMHAGSSVDSAARLDQATETMAGSSVQSAGSSAPMAAAGDSAAKAGADGGGNLATGDGGTTSMAVDSGNSDAADGGTHSDGSMPAANTNAVATADAGVGLEPAPDAAKPCTVDCPEVNEHCRGSDGAAVCDGQGTMLLCNADASVASSQRCQSETHCQAGLASRMCARCLPNQDHRCTGATLEVCAPDGQSYVEQESCASISLCNAMLGACTPQVCEPDRPVCQGDVLAICNAGGSGFARMTPCAAGMCDLAGGDCNQCVPGSKRCSSNALETCKDDGQGYERSDCPDNGKCVGSGQCVACTLDSDCRSLTTGCKVGYCGSDQRCATKNAPDRVTTCSLLFGSAGMCSRGSCVGCIDDASCASNPSGPICDFLFQSCGECSGSRGCPAGKVCSLDNHCISDTSTNPPPTTTFTLRPCSDGACPSSSCQSWNWCSQPCTTESDCPKPTGQEFVTCDKSGSSGYCYYHCPGGAPCPSGTTCNGGLSCVY